MPGSELPSALTIEGPYQALEVGTYHLAGPQVTDAPFAFRIGPGEDCHLQVDIRQEAVEFILERGRLDPTATPPSMTRTIGVPEAADGSHMQYAVVALLPHTTGGHVAVTVSQEKFEALCPQLQQVPGADIDDDFISISSVGDRTINILPSRQHLVHPGTIIILGVPVDEAISSDYVDALPEARDVDAVLAVEHPLLQDQVVLRVGSESVEELEAIGICQLDVLSIGEQQPQ